MLALVVLLAFPSPVRSSMPVVAAVSSLAALAVLVLLARVLPRGGASRWARALRTARSDVARRAARAGATGCGVVVASAVVVAGHLATFLVAARAAGVARAAVRAGAAGAAGAARDGRAVNVGGFGPREGVAAWAFGAAGLTAGQGVATALVYGALVLVASLPGAAVLLDRGVGSGRRPGSRVRRRLLSRVSRTRRRTAVAPDEGVPCPKHCRPRRSARR